MTLKRQGTRVMEVSGWAQVGGEPVNLEGKPQTHARRSMAGQSGPQPAHSVGVTPLSPFPIGRVLEHLSSLSREVNLDYERSMNKINFDQIVSSKPDTFSYVTLPKKEEEKVPRQGEGGWTKAGPRAICLARALLPFL